MKIGIDIDDTLFDTDEVLISCALQYDKEFVNNRGFRDKNSYHFVEKFYWNKNNCFDCWNCFIWNRNIGYFSISLMDFDFWMFC